MQVAVIVLLFISFLQEHVKLPLQIKEDIWSHMSYANPSVTQNGKTISKYSCSPEIRGSNVNGANITTIGVICHEMAHNLLNIPDFYDTNYETGGKFDGTGRWDLMASGNYNGTPSGSRPAHFNMYTKVQKGWVTPVTLNSPTVITNMPNSAENPVAYRINTTTSNEYFLLENRQPVKFDTNIPGINGGLVIYRVHSNVGNSCINCTHPQRVYPVYAASTYALPIGIITTQVPNINTYGTINSSGCPFP